MWPNIAEYLYFERHYFERLKSCRNSVFVTWVEAYLGSFLTHYSDIPPFVPCNHNHTWRVHPVLYITPSPTEKHESNRMKSKIKETALFFPATNSGTGYSLRNLAGRLLWQSPRIVKKLNTLVCPKHITPHLSYYEVLTTYICEVMPSKTSPHKCKY